jgi:predicted Fe-Mo cluster-binding NifX family protein
MKIVISAMGKEKESILDRRFGRCEYFQIFDTETSEFKVVTNKAVNANGGAGIAAANQVIDEGANVLITGNLGPNAYELIEKAGIDAYSCASVPVLQAIEMYQNNQLESIKAAGRAHHGMHH